MGCLFALLAIVCYILGFFLNLNGLYFYGLLSIFVATALIAIGKAIVNHIPVNKLFANGDIVGKDLKYIEDIIGQHTDVDVSNNNSRVYKWQDRLEIICDKNNVCKEVLKRN
ncbi:MAG: hypothetical protein IJY25_04590 [Bacilli bacterium]|nr:hypothetical protein [Bacilli bacterium]